MSGDLLARLIAALKPSRVLDFEIHLMVFGDQIWPAHDMSGRITNPNAKMSEYLASYRDVIDADDQDFDFPRYTKLFEAALTLLPPLVFVEISGGTDTLQPGVWPAVSLRWLPPGQTYPKKWHGTVQGGPSFALAMCRAAIEVRNRMAGEG